MGGQLQIGSTAGFRPRDIAFLIAGAVVSLFILLFAAVNDDWVAIHIPYAPWTREPSWSAFEARLWGVMAVSFVAGVIFAVFGAVMVHRTVDKRTASQQRRIEALEEELEKTTRLLAATRKSL